MLAYLQDLVGLTGQEMATAAVAVFAAGLVRGFAGFALSAVMMASLVVLIPPVSLIPVCFLLEGIASLVMLRGGVAHADKRIAWGLALTSAVGVPIGLYATNSFEADFSKSLALIVLLLLTAAQLLKFRPRFLATPAGLYSSGLTAGIATGLASVGGMVVALYVLSSDVDARRMRASLVLYLALGMFSSGFYLFYFEMLNPLAMWRALALAPIMLFGLACGTLLFRPSLIHLYKLSCLVLLSTLCLLALLRQLL